MEEQAFSQQNSVWTTWPKIGRLATCEKQLRSLLTFASYLGRFRLRDWKRLALCKSVQLDQVKRVLRRSYAKLRCNGMRKLGREVQERMLPKNRESQREASQLWSKKNTEVRLTRSQEPGSTLFDGAFFIGIRQVRLALRVACLCVVNPQLNSS